MKYKLFKDSANDITSIIKTVLQNRGVSNINDFMVVDKSHCLSYELLDHIGEAVECIVKHIETNSNIHIVVDSDADGICSAAMLYRYLKKYAPSLNITYSLHTGKQHGLSEDIVIPEGTNLILLPDAGSNDYEQHKRYKAQGMDIIVLDHHKCDAYSEDAIVVNNQMSANYTNKHLCGAGITYKFLKALDDEMWNNDANNYLDLVAVANIGDVMDSRSLETRYYMLEGLKRIESNAINALREKQSFSIGDSVTLINVAFYITPLINGMIRAGTAELKELMFQAFCEIYSEYDYTKRDKTVVKENIYDRMARECVNAKKRQDTQKAKIIPNIMKHIEKIGMDKNKVILCNTDDLLTQEMTGLMCIEVAKRYKRPALLYRTRVNDGKDGGIKEITYEGSGRNYDDFDISNLLAYLQESGLFTKAEGHDNAMGIGFIPDNEEKIIELFNRDFADYDVDGTYTVDFLLDFVDLDDNAFIEMERSSGIWGQKVDEPSFAIQDVDILLNSVNISEGKTGTTVKFEVDGITFIKFKANDDDEILRICRDWEYDVNNAKLNVVGRIGMNNFSGTKSKQVNVIAWELVKQEVK